MFTIRPCESDEDFASAAGLAAELAAWDMAETQRLGICADDVASFYYPADATLRLTLLASAGSTPAACISDRELSPGICELKRLYVRPMFRGRCLGALMIAALVEQAVASRYSRICLETTRFMKAATRLYEDAGFVRCEPYYAVPAEFRDLSIFMQKDIGPI